MQASTTRTTSMNTANVHDPGIYPLSGMAGRLMYQGSQAMSSGDRRPDGGDMARSVKTIGRVSEPAGMAMRAAHLTMSLDS